MKKLYQNALKRQLAMKDWQKKKKTEESKGKKNQICQNKILEEKRSNSSRIKIENKER